MGKTFYHRYLNKLITRTVKDDAKMSEPKAFMGYVFIHH